MKNDDYIRGYRDAIDYSLKKIKIVREELAGINFSKHDKEMVEEMLRLFDLVLNISDLEEDNYIKCD